MEKTLVRPTATLDAVVGKHNSLISKLAPFGKSELRLIAFCVAQYDSRKSENRMFSATVDELKELFPMNTNAAYDVVKQAMLSINKKPLEIQEGNIKKLRNWFSGFDYYEGEGRFTFIITPEIAPYLLELKSNFTRYRLKYVYQFKSANSWKLYENLKRWENTGRWDVPLEELRMLLGVVGMYPRWNSLKGRIIDPAVMEINKYSDLSIQYSYIKHVRTITGLNFVIKNKPEDRRDTPTASPVENIYAALRSVGVAVEKADSLVEAARQSGRLEVISGKLEKKMADSKAKKNPPGWLVRWLEIETRQGNLPFSLQKSQDECWKSVSTYGCKFVGMMGTKDICEGCEHNMP